MAVKHVGALPFPNTPPRRRDQNNVQNAITDNGPTGTVNNTVTRNAINGATTTNTAQINVNTNPPPPQAATTPGTGQKVNIIA